MQKDCQARNLNKEDAMDRGRWKKLIKIGSGQRAIKRLLLCCVLAKMLLQWLMRL